MFIKKIIIFTFFISIATGITPLHAIHVPFFSSSVAKQYNDMLEEEDETIRQEFFALNGVNISKEEWQELKEQYVTEYNDLLKLNIKSSLQPFSKSIQKLVQNIMKNQRVQNITILHSTEGNDDITTYGRGYIVISEKFLQAMCINDTQIEAAMLHEIMHIKNDDELEKYCQAKLAEQNTATTNEAQQIEFLKKFEKLMKKKHHLNEKRADIQAGLVDIKYARAFKAFLENLHNNNPTFSGNETHPSHKTRIAYMTELINAMEQEEKASMLGKIKALFNAGAPKLQTH